MERHNGGGAVAGGIPNAAHRRVVAGRLYAQAAMLLLAAERAAAEQGATANQPAPRLRATAARLQWLAAWLEAPVPAVMEPAPVAVTAVARWPRRSA